METKEKIKKFIRKIYGNVATRGGYGKDSLMVSACIGGAATIEDTKLMLKEAGFNDINITPKKVSQELIDEWLPGSRAGEYVVSAYIEAKKPLKRDHLN